MKFNNERRLLQEEHTKKLDNLVNREKKIDEVLKSNEVIRRVAELYADMQTWNLQESERYLRNKERPARKAADEVSFAKRIADKSRAEWYVMKHKWHLLLKTFPELSKYAEDDSNDVIIALTANKSIKEYQDNYDKRHDYLTKEEWYKLTEAQKSDLALERYNKGEKSNWVVGVEYEMFVEHKLKEFGFKTIPNGSLKGLNDLGRDILAEQDNTILVIQCKRYGKGKEIHENTICQLYGTAIEYEISSKKQIKTIPVLYTTVNLSETAQKFAQRLGVDVKVLAMDSFPQIKCNISSTGEKIYHLPFDQQYYNTKIDKKGEFFAWTAQEAENAGFRRARKHTT